jgi:hypothetical protein
MPLYDNPDQHGADPIAEWLDRPRGDTTNRQCFANLASAFLGCSDIAAQVKEAGLDTNEIIAHLMGWRET